jgi:hypothetical protein
MAGDGTENWRLILEAARALTAAGQSPFTRAGVYEWIWRRYPRSVHDRPSLDPVFQGMARNAPGGPTSSAGTPLARVGRGEYVLADAAAVPEGASAGPVPLPAPGRGGAVLPARNEVRQDAKEYPGAAGNALVSRPRRVRGAVPGPSRLSRASVIRARGPLLPSPGPAGGVGAASGRHRLRAPFPRRDAHRPVGWRAVRPGDRGQVPALSPLRQPARAPHALWPAPRRLQ